MAQYTVRLPNPIIPTLEHGMNNVQTTLHTNVVTFPYYERYSTRYDTYLEWPQIIMTELPLQLICDNTIAAVKRQIHELAISSFFYSCVSDITICSFCGLTLQNWHAFFTKNASDNKSHRNWRMCFYSLLQHAF